jgi:hypothetical protein
MGTKGRRLARTRRETPIATLRTPTLETLGLGTVLEIFRRG